MAEVNGDSINQFGAGGLHCHPVQRDLHSKPMDWSNSLQGCSAPVCQSLYDEDEKALLAL